MKTDHPPFKLIIALGNPGEEYDDTYHNAGFLALDRFMEQAADEKKIAWKQVKGTFKYFKNDDAIWAKPLVFMNDSGRAVQAALAYLKLPAEEMLVVHDDSDLAIGEYKLSFDHGSAGHNGVKSIIEHLGTQKFWRLRIGIRPDTVETRRAKAGEFVLRKINKENQGRILEAVEKAKSELFGSMAL